MSNMFKKTLVAAALTAFAASSHAVVVGTNLTDDAPAKVAAEWVATQTAKSAAADRTITVPDSLIQLDLGGSVTYVNGDIIEVSFTGAEVVTSASPTIVRQGGAASGITYQGIKSGTTNTYVFLVSDATLVDDVDTVPDPDVNTGKVLELRGVVLKSTGLANAVSVAYRATNSAGNVEKDNFGTTSAQFIDVRSQFAFEVSEKLDGKVDPAARHRFSGAGVNDTFKVKVTNLSGGTWAASLRHDDADRLDLVAKGDFAAFVDKDGKAYNPLTCANNGFISGVDNALASSLTATQKTVRFTNAANGNGSATAAELTCTFDVTSNPAGKALPLTAFSLDAVLGTEATPSVARLSVSAQDLGKFTLDATQITVPYMPFGDNITHVINLTNTGSVAGDITVEAIDRTGKKYGPVSVGTAAAGTQIALGETIKTELLKAGMPATERAQLSIVTNVKSGVELYTAYNVGGTGARIVVNSSNGK